MKSPPMALPRITIPFTYSDLIQLFLSLAGPVSSEQGVVAAFESDFAARYGFPPGVCFCKARVAFFHLLNSMDLPADSEVVISAIHVADFVNMILLSGHRPVVVDLKPGSYVMDLDDLNRKMTSRTAVVLVTHLSGYAMNMDQLLALTRPRGIRVVEDCSQALTTTYRGQPMGTFADAAIFSLSLLKPVGALFGGMVISRDTTLLERLRLIQRDSTPPSRAPLLWEAMKNLAFKIALSPVLFNGMLFPLIRIKPDFGASLDQMRKYNKSVQWRNTMPDAFKEGFSPQQARLGMKQMTRLLARERSRAERGSQLHRALYGVCRRVVIPPPTPEGTDAFWLFPVLVDDPVGFMDYMKRKGIDTSRMLLSVLSREEAFASLKFHAPHAEEIRSHTVFIPMYPELRPEDVDRMVEALLSYDTLGRP